MDGTGDRRTSTHLHNYTRNGFTGSRTNVIRAGYAPAYTRIEGDYAPRRFDTNDLDVPAFSTGRDLPVPVLQGHGVSIEVARRTAPTNAALKNVLGDEVHFILSGGARLETDFGVMDVRSGDFVVIPRAAAYRFAAIAETLNELVIVTESELAVDPDPAATLNVSLYVDAPAPYDDPVGRDGEHEVVVRHRGGVTSYFYGFDPLRCVRVIGAPQIRRFNIENVRGLGVTEGGIIPSRMIDDPTTRTLFYYLGARRSDRPPIHCNADYDEVIVYSDGPGTYGAMTRPGTIAWSPKGVSHHGAEEDVETTYQAWLLETRAALDVTPAGQSIARLMETGEYGLHPSEENVG